MASWKPMVSKERFEVGTKMKTFSWMFLAGVICLAASAGGCARQRTEAKESTDDKAADKAADLKSAGKAFVDLLSKGDFAKATKDFDGAMLKAMPADKLEGLWKGLAGQFGPFKKQ